MKIPQPKPRAMAAMGANRAAEHNVNRVAEAIELAQAIAKRVVELTDQVATLTQRVEDLEAK